jgi:hypothetical protein
VERVDEHCTLSTGSLQEVPSLVLEKIWSTCIASAHEPMREKWYTTLAVKRLCRSSAVVTTSVRAANEEEKQRHQPRCPCARVHHSREPNRMKTETE